MVAIALLLSTTLSLVHAEFIIPRARFPQGLTKISEQENEEVSKICGLQPGLNKINDGTIAKKGQFPWAVAIEGNDGQRFCSGTIISPRHVLTAAHCTVKHAWLDGDKCKSASLKSASKEVEEVLLGGSVAYGGNCNFASGYFHLNMTGSSCVDDDMKRIRISGVAWERRYRDRPSEDRCTNFDIAIIEVEENFVWSDFAHPACLLLTDSVYDDSLASFFGFGFVKNGQFEESLFGKADGRTKEFFPDLRYGAGLIKRLDKSSNLVVNPRGMSESQQQEMETTGVAQVEEGDSGGGIIMACMSRNIIIGVATESLDGEARKSRGSQVFPHSRQICKLTGVCPIKDHCDF